MKYSLDISNFLEEIPSLSHPTVFLYFFALITEEGFLISPCYPLEFCIQMGISLLFSFAFLFLFFSQLFVRPPQTTFLHFAFLHFSFLRMVLITASCMMLQTFIHSFSCTLSDLIPRIYLSLPLYNCKLFDLGIREWSSGFPYFLQLKSEFGNEEFMIWATVSFQSYFCWLHTTFPSLAAKNEIILILVLTILWCPCVELSLALLEEGVCCDQCVLLAKLLAFALLHCVLLDQTCLLLQVSLDFQLSHSSPLWCQEEGSACSVHLFPVPKFIGNR